jgi:HD-GYP domain-containing protein (c-di-GMP phosphodiesterase class II)
MEHRGQRLAMCISDRPYRAAWPRERVLKHIRKGSGSHFDPDVAEVFLREIRLHGT